MSGKRRAVRDWGQTGRWGRGSREGQCGKRVQAAEGVLRGRVRRARATGGEEPREGDWTGSVVFERERSEVEGKGLRVGAGAGPGEDKGARRCERGELGAKRVRVGAQLGTAKG